MIPTPIPTEGSPERERHLLALARHIVSHLFTWTMPADYGVDYGIERDESGRGGSTTKWERCYLSAAEILGEIDWPAQDFDEDEGWSTAVEDYAKALMLDVGPFLRKCVVNPSGNASEVPKPSETPEPSEPSPWAGVDPVNIDKARAATRLAGPVGTFLVEIEFTTDRTSGYNSYIVVGFRDPNGPHRWSGSCLSDTIKAATTAATMVDPRFARVQAWWDALVKYSRGEGTGKYKLVGKLVWIEVRAIRGTVKKATGVGEETTFHAADPIPWRDVGPTVRVDQPEPRPPISGAWASSDTADPVFHDARGWHFHDETWSDSYGPWADEATARTALAAYLSQLNTPTPQVGQVWHYPPGDDGTRMPRERMILAVEPIDGYRIWWPQGWVEYANGTNGWPRASARRRLGSPHLDAAAAARLAHGLRGEGRHRGGRRPGDDCEDLEHRRCVGAGPWRAGLPGAASHRSALRPRRQRDRRLRARSALLDRGQGSALGGA